MKVRVGVRCSLGWPTYFLPMPHSALEPAVFFEGRVTHTRRKPVHHSLGYDVRMAVVSLDCPPSWFTPRGTDLMDADRARKMAGRPAPTARASPVLPRSDSLLPWQAQVALYTC